jgi:hypothetical protein
VGSAEPQPYGGPYGVLYADPPWQYEHPISDSRAIENQYPTMDIDEICALEPFGLSMDEILLPVAVLFLWSPAPLVPAALSVIDAWGFLQCPPGLTKKGWGWLLGARATRPLLAVRGEMSAPIQRTGQRPSLSHRRPW